MEHLARWATHDYPLTSSYYPPLPTHKWNYMKIVVFPTPLFHSYELSTVLCYMWCPQAALVTLFPVLMHHMCILLVLKCFEVIGAIDIKKPLCDSILNAQTTARRCGQFSYTRMIRTMCRVLMVHVGTNPTEAFSIYPLHNRVFTLGK